MKRFLFLFGVFVMLNNGKIYFYPDGAHWMVDSAAFGPARVVDIYDSGYVKKYATFMVKDVKIVSLTDPLIDQIPFKDGDKIVK